MQILKTIDESSLDLESTKALKVGGSYLKNKMADTTFFSKVVAFDPKINTGT